MSPGGTIFLSGARMDLYVSPDRGRNWRESPSLRPAAALAARLAYPAISKPPALAGVPKLSST